MSRRISPMVALVALVAWVGVAQAQEGTPGAGTDGLPVTPDPAECVVEPRTVEDLRELAGTPVPFGPPPGADTASPAPHPTTPPSEPADAETVAGIVATVRQFIACVNAGDELRGYALYTDEFVRTGVVLDPAIEQPAAPEPPDERVTLLAVVYVQEYQDGRVGAVVVIDDPLAPSPAEPYFFVFTRVDDRWLFDEWPATTFVPSRES